ncbi:O-acetylserine/cysteine efflux transporter [Amycolatopsis arida]|uniref:O-acetylserine/cysteine efflux transporter n=1 Tax=Amycolatopsis arida TaxID=587909 RepID=A0A1I5S8P8_9PSEU|nr:EamA family transporter [Amycolatopsis arida]TDX85322.1 O-acetylserine/cysteine efflux transporter [Amycolatopsis arida]SFP67083.1 O-acetylserine/cysteine efflux transporter [Amycolatopsis arida]
MSPRDRLLAGLVALIWGVNFLAIHAAVEHFPPLFAGALRFLVIAIPTLLLVPRPPVRLRWLLGYGLGFGTFQFAFLFVGMDLGMPAGLASLVLQACAPFTVLLGALLLREPVTARQLAGVGLAVAGMVAIGWQRAEHAALPPVVLTVLAALSWAVGNLCSRQALSPAQAPRPGDRANPLHLTLWMSVVPPVPLFTLSLLFEGPAAQWASLATLDTATGWWGLAGLGYVVLIGTIAGSGIWTTLLRRNPAGVVAPFALLVPVVGMSLAFVLLGERPTVVELAAAMAVVTGVLVGTWSPAQASPGGSRRFRRVRRATSTATATPATAASANQDNRDNQASTTTPR